MAIRALICAWSGIPHANGALSIGIENLLDDAHTEFDDRAGVNASEVPRTVYGQATLRF